MSPAVKEAQGVRDGTGKATSPGLLSMHLFRSFVLLFDIAIVAVSYHNIGGKASVAILLSAASSAIYSVYAYLGRGVPMLGVRLGPEAISGGFGIYTVGATDPHHSDKGLVQTWGGTAR